MPKGPRESSPALDLDEQVQQLVESIETTTRDITARSAEDFGEGPLTTPQAMAALAKPRPAVAVAEEPVGPDELDAVSFDSPEELGAGVETEPAEAFDSVEAVEGALDQIDEAVDRLVENAVGCVIAPEAAPPTETVEDMDTVDAAEAPDADEIAGLVREAVEASAIEPTAEADSFDGIDAVDAVDAVDRAGSEDAEDTEDAGLARAIADLEKAQGDANANTDAEQTDEFAVEGDFDSVNEIGPAIASAPARADGDPAEEPDDAIDDFGEISAPAPAAVADIGPTAGPGSAAAEESAPAEVIIKPAPAPSAAPDNAGATKPPGGMKRIPALVASMAGRLAPAAARAVVLVNAPLLRLGPSARQIVGLVAINTAFLAVCVLIIVLLRTAL
jgi:hypothetical protein